jgi:hypothetical protein
MPVIAGTAKTLRIGGASHDPTANRRFTRRMRNLTMQHRRRDVDGARRAQGMHARPSATLTTFVRRLLRRSRQ